MISRRRSAPTAAAMSIECNDIGEQHSHLFVFGVLVGRCDQRTACVTKSRALPRLGATRTARRRRRHRTLAARARARFRQRNVGRNPTGRVGRSFCFQLLIATTDPIGHTAKRTVEAQEKQASRLSGWG